MSPGSVSTENGRMTEYVNVRASETLGQGELVSFLKSRFPRAAKPVGRTIVEGTECVEVRVASNSPEFEEIILCGWDGGWHVLLCRVCVVSTIGGAFV